MSKKDLINRVIYLFLIIPFFSIAYINYKFPITYNALNLWVVFDFAIILFISIRNYKSISKPTLLICAFLAFGIIITYINKGNLYSMIMIFLKVAGLSLLLDYTLKNDTQNILFSFDIFFKSLLIINFLTILIFPNGLYVGNTGYTENWLLGYKNSLLTYIFPALVFDISRKYNKYSKITIGNYLYIMLILATVILTKSSTAIIFVSIISLGFLLKLLKVQLRGINIVSTSVVYIISFFSIVIFRMQNYFRWLIVDILHKDITLTNRTYVWDYVMQFISRKKWFGYGLEYSNIRYNKTNIIKTYHAHNEILEVMYQFGIVGLFLFILAWYYSLKKLWEHRNDEYVKIIVIIVFALMIAFLTEAYSYEYYMYLLVLFYNVEAIIENKGKNS